MMFGRGYNGFSNCFGYGGGGMMMAAFILLAVVAVIYFSKRSTHRKANNDALESLKMRFAKGEISEEEYLRRKNILD